MIFRTLCLLMMMLFLSATTLAADTPEISFRGDDELGDYITDGLIVEHLGISIDIRAGLAQVSFSAVLRNETEDDIEARFSYPLPDGSVINGYALDIGGTLVDGVLMPKERAETLYTDRVTQSVDPGIAARTVDNRYQTRIYPIAAEGGRRQIRLDFAVPVPASGLRLPLVQSQAAERVTLNITGDGAANAKTPLQASEELNTTISGEIFIPSAASGPALSRHAKQNFLTVPLAAQKTQTKEEAASVAIIWDSSLSREVGNLESERRFVSEVLTRLAPQKQSLIHGANKVDFSAAYQTPAQLGAALTTLSYDGATNLGALLDSVVLSRADIRADICLVITDGRSTLGEAGLPNLPCRVFTYSAAESPNTDWLALLAARNAGTDLTGLGASEAARLIVTGGGPQLAAGQAGEIVSAGARHWLILPVSEKARAFSVKFKTEAKRIGLRDLETTASPAAGSIWGQRHMAELRTGGPQKFDAVVEASRRWNVQTEETAFLVLEEADDYIEAKIDPPKSFPADPLENYKEQLAEAREEEADDLEDHLDNLRDDWEDQIEWWETDWGDEADIYRSSPRPQPVMPAPPPLQSNTPNFTCWNGTSVSNSAQCPAQSTTGTEPQLGDMDASEILKSTTEVHGQQDVADEESELDYIVVTGARRVNPAGELPAEIKIETRAWSPDRPFLTALKGLDAAAFETEYIRQRKTHGDRPSFYLELADQLHRKGATDRAAQMAATALDLGSATSVTRTNVADRLLMYGRTATAITLYRDVLPASQDRPQPFYNLALGLIQAGDDSKGGRRETYYREAFEHLIHVIIAPWEDDYEGIHLIALQDLNRTLARLPKRTRRKFQKELGLESLFYKNLPVDIRILIDWTANDADLDIHVIERVGAEDSEEAYYSNRATDSGGRVSNDMTEGYGPEEYMIRRAPNGLYRVESDYYAQDDYNEDGALKLRARLWRNFGRKDETYQTVIIEMLEEKEDAYILGEIQVGPKTQDDETIAVKDATE